MTDDPYARHHFIDDAVGRYAAAHSSPADEVQRRLRATTAEVAGQWAVMQVGDDQAVLLEILTRAVGAQHAVEVGTFTGSSALAIARGLGGGGKLLCCDVNEAWTAVARDAWEQAGVADRIELRIGPAIDTLRELPEHEHLDLAFLDADKTGYAAYFDELVPRLRPGGLLIADNTLQWGRVVDDAVTDDSVVAIRAFNDKVLADERVRCVLLPMGDGVSVVQKWSAS